MPILRKINASLLCLILSVGCSDDEAMKSRLWQVEEDERDSDVDIVVSDLSELDEGRAEDDMSSCIWPAELSEKVLDEPCQVSWCNNRVDPGCAQRCYEGDCESPMPPTCIQGEAYYCEDDEIYDVEASKNMGRWKRATDLSCCDIKSADIVTYQPHIMEVEKGNNRGRLKDYPFCYDMSSSDVRVEVAAHVENRGNLPVNVTCKWSWQHVRGPTHKWYQTVSMLTVNWQAMFSNGETEYLLEPGEVTSVEVGQWPSNEVCFSYVYLRCSEKVDDFKMSYAELPIYFDLCNRLSKVEVDPANLAVGKVELDPVESCSPQAQSTLFEVEP